MPIPHYIRFVLWADAQVEPFTYMDVEKAFHLPREWVVNLVAHAVEKDRLVRVGVAHWRARPRGLPGEFRKTGA